MHNEFTAVFERDGEWDVAYSSEIPGANGQGQLGPSEFVSREAGVLHQSVARSGGGADAWKSA